MTRIPTDPEQIRQLVSMMVELGLTEIELSDKDGKVRVVRGSASAVPNGMASPQQIVTQEPRHPIVGEVGVSHAGAVTSPMVGVVYLAPEPGAPNFVSVGDMISTGQTLLLIEAMKTFNQIKASRSGTVSRVIVRNGSPVEYGELLMVIE